MTITNFIQSEKTTFLENSLSSSAWELSNRSYEVGLFDLGFDGDEEEKGPALEIYGTDLTLLAQEGLLEECFGREKELSEMMEILVRRQKNNPVLVGDAGVGKTAIVELFASKIVNNLVPFVLEGRTIVSIDLARIVAGSRYRGEFELRFQRVLDEVLEQPHIIIFIDEIHNIGGAGSAEGSLDAANILKPVLSRSGFQCIGATTTKEYQKIEKDPALNRRFQPIKVKEPSIEETVKILYGLRASLEAFHNVEILPGALRLAADLSSRYIYDRFLPDKAIDLIDRAAAKEVIRLTSVTEGSVLSSLVNAAINSLGSLRLECFRRGDTASEYIFQEIETGYRNFLLRWIESPLKVEQDVLEYTKSESLLSPLSQSLIDSMKVAVLKRVDQLLFSSSNPRSLVKYIKKHRRLSAEKNEDIFNVFYIDSDKEISETRPKMSLHRISLFLLKTWLNFSKIEENQAEEKEKIVRYLFADKRIAQVNEINKQKKIDSFLLLKEAQTLNEQTKQLSNQNNYLSPINQEEGNLNLEKNGNEDTFSTTQTKVEKESPKEKLSNLNGFAFLTNKELEDYSLETQILDAQEELKLYESYEGKYAFIEQSQVLNIISEVNNLDYSELENLISKEDIDSYFLELKKELYLEDWVNPLEKFIPFLDKYLPFSASILEGNELKTSYYEILRYFVNDLKMYDHLYDIREKLFENPFLFVFEKDFCEEDIEYYEETFELLSELETRRIEVFKEFLRDLKPVIRRGIVETLKTSSAIPMTQEEINTVYMLLGYFSTTTGKSFLGNLDDPELIQNARKLGDFTGLKKRITQKEIRQLLSDMTGIPIQSISNLESQKLLNLESTLHQRVIGQDEAISAIAKAIRRSRLGIQNPNRPIASFLFCGPTGVGKTEVTKALAVSLFGAETDMIRFDMSEFMEKFTVSRLIGSPPGYVGYDEGGQLTDAVRRKPYSVVLFDEIEKAHPDILNVLLQILEDGRLTDSQKRLVPFENTVIIMTSNAAAEEIQQIIKADKNNASPEERKLEEERENQKKEEKEKEEENNKKEELIYQDEYSGAIEFLNSPITENFLTDIRKELQQEFKKSFRNIKEDEFLKNENNKLVKGKEKKDLEQETLKTLKSAVLERLSTIFLPEFLNRLDDIIIFQPLKPEELRKICDIMIRSLAERVKAKQIRLLVDDNVRKKLTREGYNPIFGARPLRRLVTKYIEDLISEQMLKNPTTKKERIIDIQLNELDQIFVKEIEEPEYKIL